MKRDQGLKNMAVLRRFSIIRLDLSGLTQFEQEHEFEHAHEYEHEREYEHACPEQFDKCYSELVELLTVSPVEGSTTGTTAFCLLPSAPLRL